MKYFVLSGYLNYRKNTYIPFFPFILGLTFQYIICIRIWSIFLEDLTSFFLGSPAHCSETYMYVTKKVRRINKISYWAT
jgi:hypothetical protein